MAAKKEKTASALVIGEQPPVNESPALVIGEQVVPTEENALTIPEQGVDLGEQGEQGEQKDGAPVIDKKAEKAEAVKVAKAKREAEKAAKLAAKQAEKTAKEAEKVARSVKEERNGVKKPNPNTSGGAIWESIAKLSLAKGELCTLAEVKADCKTFTNTKGETVDVNEANIPCELWAYKKFHGIVAPKVEKAPKPEKPAKAEKAPKASKAAKAAGTEEAPVDLDTDDTKTEQLDDSVIIDE